MATPYAPGQLPSLPDEYKALEPVLTALVKEFSAVREAFVRAEDFAELRVLHAAPEKVRNGMEVEADGTDWNPGSGAGKYVYRSGAWVFIG